MKYRVIFLQLLLALAPSSAAPVREFKAGECWSYKTRPGEEGSFVAIRKIEALPNQGEVVHVSVVGLSSEHPGGTQSNAGYVAHIPIAGPNFRASVRLPIEKEMPTGGWEEAYRAWSAGYDAGKQRVLALPIAECISWIENSQKRFGDSPSSIRYLMDCVGMKVSSPEFQVLHDAYRLKVWKSGEDLMYSKPDNGFIVKSSFVTYRGEGLVVQAYKREYLDRKTKSVLYEEKRGVAEYAVTRISLVLGDCDEKWWCGIWQGELPEIVIPKDAETLLRTYPSRESDMTEETYLTRAPDERVIMKSRRRIGYAFRFSSIDTFPFVFEFDENKLVLLTIYSTYNEIKVVPPTPPSSGPNQSVQPTPGSVTPRASEGSSK